MPNKESPSQKMFESKIFWNIKNFKNNGYVFVENESSRVGELYIPSKLKLKMNEAKRIRLKVTNLETRVKYIRK